MTLDDLAQDVLTSDMGKSHEKCGVMDCEQEHTEVVELKPFDPIDHSPTIVPLCDEHLPWAREHNNLAEEVHEEFRDCRKEIGQRYAADVNRLKTPPNGELDDAVSVDKVAQITDMVREMFSEDGLEIEDVDQ